MHGKKEESRRKVFGLVNWDDIYAYIPIYLELIMYNVFNMYSSYIWYITMYNKIDIYSYFKVGMIRSWFWTDLRCLVHIQVEVYSGQLNMWV